MCAIMRGLNVLWQHLMQGNAILLVTSGHSALSPWMVTEFVLGTKRYNILNLKHKDINLRFSGMILYTVYEGKPL